MDLPSLMSLLWDKLGVDTAIICSTISWLLWRYRNDIVHNNPTMDLDRIAENACVGTYEFQQVKKKLMIGDAHRKNSPTRWSVPLPGRLKLNVDAAIFANGSGTGIGAIIRDERGITVGAISKRLPNPYSPLVAECIAIREGLSFAFNCGLQTIYVESDCLMAIQAINGNDPSVIDSIISDIRDLFRKVSGGSCSHIPRCCNVAAHTLAKESITMNNDVSWFNQIPPCIEQIVTADAML